MTRASKALAVAERAYMEAVQVRDPLHLALSEQAYRAALARVQRQEATRG